MMKCADVDKADSGNSRAVKHNDIGQVTGLAKLQVAIVNILVKVPARGPAKESHPKSSTTS